MLLGTACRLREQFARIEDERGLVEQGLELAGLKLRFGTMRIGCQANADAKILDWVTDLIVFHNTHSFRKTVYCDHPCGNRVWRLDALVAQKVGTVRESGAGQSRSTSVAKLGCSSARRRYNSEPRV